MINLEWYRTFKAIYQHGTLTKAAQELLISQPNVSIQLAALESYMGQPLFIRFPRKMVPTELGKQLYTQIVESIDNLERVEIEFKKSAINKIPQIRLGSPSEVFTNYLALNITSLDFLVEATFDLAQNLILELEKNNLDIAIITNKGKDENQLTYEPLIVENIMVVASANFDSEIFDEYLTSADTDKIEGWLKQQSWIVYNNNLSMIRRFWRVNFNKRPLVKVKSVIPDYNAILTTVSNSNSLAVTSDLIAGNALNEGRIKILWKGSVITSNNIYLAYDKNKIDPKYVEQLKEYIVANTIIGQK